MENSSISKETFIDRLEFFMKTEGLNSNSLTVAAGLSNGLIGKALKNRSSMNSDSIERILCAYTNLSAEWLMTGKGTMYVNDQPAKASDIPNNLNSDSLVFFLRDRNKELECENRRLLVENASLRTRLELLDDSKNKTG
nr:MAG TPA: Regulatory protein-modification, helix-turn-helix, transcriptional regulato, DNA [Siphoviridae sp. ctEfY6]